MGLDLPVLMIDAIHFRSHIMLIVLGIDTEGRKHVLGMRQGANENTAVVRELIVDLIERGLNAEAPRLIVIDGARALRGRSPSASATRPWCSAAKCTSFGTSVSICPRRCTRTSSVLNGIRSYGHRPLRSEPAWVGQMHGVKQAATAPKKRRHFPHFCPE
jgi:hypothetical protein